MIRLGGWVFGTVAIGTELFEVIDVGDTLLELAVFSLTLVLVTLVTAVAGVLTDVDCTD
jgi:hypothetical protein